MQAADRMEYLGRRKLAQQNLASREQDDAASRTSHILTPEEASPPAGHDAACTELQTQFPTHAVKGAKGAQGWILYSGPERCNRVRAIIERAYEDYSLGGLRPTNLQLLIRINAINAMVRNAEAMGFPTQGLCAYDYISPWNRHGPQSLHAPALPPPSCPETLRPTALQRRFEHHPWIDMLPFPRFRDNVLLAMEGGFLDDDDLCFDIAETDTPLNDVRGRPALIVWGEAWDSAGWEVNAAFVRRWGWLLRGCPEIIEGTNHWRGRRGEKRIVFDTT